MLERDRLALPFIPGIFAAGAALLVLCGCVGGRPEPTSAPPAGQASTGPEEPFFVGLWAAEERLCADPWRFTAEGIETPAGVVCRFERLTRIPQGYRAESTCTAEGPPAPARITLSYAQSAQALLVEGAPFRDIGLIACPQPGT